MKRVKSQSRDLNQPFIIPKRRCDLCYSTPLVPEDAAGMTTTISYSYIVKQSSVLIPLSLSNNTSLFFLLNPNPNLFLTMSGRGKG
jgi:hypothetical protein